MLFKIKITKIGLRILKNTGLNGSSIRYSVSICKQIFELLKTPGTLEYKAVDANRPSAVKSVNPNLGQVW